MNTKMQKWQVKMIQIRGMFKKGMMMMIEDNLILFDLTVCS